MKNLLKSKIFASGNNINSVAEKIGVSSQTITNWCNNRNLDNILKFKELLIILNVEITEVFIDE